MRKVLPCILELFQLTLLLPFCIGYRLLRDRSDKVLFERKQSQGYQGGTNLDTVVVLPARRFTTRSVLCLRLSDHLIGLQ